MRISGNNANCVAHFFGEGNLADLFPGGRIWLHGPTKAYGRAFFCAETAQLLTGEQQRIIIATRGTITHANGMALLEMTFAPDTTWTDGTTTPRTLTTALTRSELHRFLDLQVAKRVPWEDARVGILC